MGALDGVRVADFTHAYAGPFCTYNLVLLGADVIKVEPPNGDDFRAREVVFASINGGKRSIALDLKIADDRELAMRLVASADVMVENFRPGVPARLGVDYPACRKRNPSLIYCSLTGYGAGVSDPPPAIEWSIQAASGLTHEYLDNSRDGWYPGLSLVDPFAGYAAFAAILAALLERREGGEGRFIDISMLDAVSCLMSQYTCTELVQGPPTYTLGARLRTADRKLYVAISHQRWFQSICEVVGAPELLADERFADGAARDLNCVALWAELERHLATDTAESWEAQLTAAGVPASAIRTFGEAAAEASRRGRPTFADVETEAGPSFASVGAFPTGSTARRVVPAIGANGPEILREMGVDHVATTVGSPSQTSS
jgi:CoA:oxalate CoA-transferase